MKRISLYTSEDSEIDVVSGKRTGKEASIRKWRLLCNALYALSNVQGSPCGLCHAQAESTCLGCPLVDSPSKKCSVLQSDYWKARVALQKAILMAQKMLTALEALP